MKYNYMSVVLVKAKFQREEAFACAEAVATDMNFFCVGFFLSLLQFNMSMTVNYVIQLIGMLFLLGGILEIRNFNSRFKRYLNPAKLMCMFFGASAAFFAIASFIGVGNKVMNFSGLIFGTMLTLVSLIYQKKLIDDISRCSELVNDASNLVRMKKTWIKLAVITLAGLAADIGNRVIPVEKAAAISGTIMLFCRIVLYVVAVALLLQFNKIRIDFNNKQESVKAQNIIAK